MGPVLPPDGDARAPFVHLTRLGRRMPTWRAPTVSFTITPLWAIGRHKAATTRFQSWRSGPWPWPSPGAASMAWRNTPVSRHKHQRVAVPVDTQLRAVGAPSTREIPAGAPPEDYTYHRLYIPYGHGKGSNTPWAIGPANLHAFAHLTYAIPHHLHGFEAISRA